MQLGPALPAQPAAGLVPGDGAGPSGGGGTEAFATVLDAQATRGQPSLAKAGVHEGHSSRRDTSSTCSDGSDNTKTDELPALLAAPMLIALLAPIQNQGANSTTSSADASVAAISPAGSTGVAAISPAGGAALTAASPAGAGMAGPGSPLTALPTAATTQDGAPPALPVQAPPASQSDSNAISKTGATLSASASLPIPGQGDSSATPTKTAAAPAPLVQAGQAPVSIEPVAPDLTGLNVVQDPRGSGETREVPKNGEVDAKAAAQAADPGNALAFQAVGEQAATRSDGVAFAASGADAAGPRASAAPPQAPQAASASGGAGSQFGHGTSDSQLGHQDSGEASQTVLPGTSPSGVMASSTSSISTEPVPAPLGAGAGRDLLGQLVAHTDRLIPAGQSSMRVQLRPASLGTVDLNLSLKDGVLSLNIHTELTHTHDMIEAALPQLRHALSERGVDSAQVSLTSSSGSLTGDFAASGSWHGDQARGGEHYTPNRGYSVSVKDPSDVAQLTAVESLSGDHTIDYRV